MTSVRPLVAAVPRTPGTRSAPAPAASEAILAEAMLDAGWLVSPDGYSDICPHCAAEQEAG